MPNWEKKCQQIVLIQYKSHLISDPESWKTSVDLVDFENSIILIFLHLMANK